VLPDGTESDACKSFPSAVLSLELNHGSRLRFFDPERAFYFFPCLLSELLKRPQFMTSIDSTTLKKALH
jgi:hypothetical protein